MLPRTRVTPVAIGLLAVAAAGCKKAAPASPSAGVPPAVTITIGRGGVTPKSVTIALGDRVLFVNDDGSTHSMGSNPHPDHTDCPSINQVGFISPGQQRETGNFVVARTCGFHDHDDPLNQTLWGTIVTR